MLDRLHFALQFLLDMTVSIFLTVFCLGLVVSFFQSVLFYVFLFFIFAFFMFLSARICVFMIAVVFILFISSVVFRSYFYCCLSCTFLLPSASMNSTSDRVYTFPLSGSNTLYPVFVIPTNFIFLILLSNRFLNCFSTRLYASHPKILILA